MPTILIVDDDEVIRTYLSESLSNSGFMTLESDNGQSALHLIKNHRVDLIVTDLFMPDMDGFDLLRNVLDYAPDAMIIVITGEHKYISSKIMLEMAKHLGAVDVLAKPFHITGLVNKIKYLLASS